MNSVQITLTALIVIAIGSLIGYYALLSPSDRWRDTQIRNGRRAQDVDDEAAVRMALAELRRQVSEEALGNGIWRQTLEAVLESQSAELTRRTPRLGRRYLDMIATLDDSDIMWPDAYKVAFPPMSDADGIELEFSADRKRLAAMWSKEDEYAAFSK
jgi:hypothetical protein